MKTQGFFKNEPQLQDITLGDDITAHYLRADAPYKIFRYKAIVYAVHYDKGRPALHIEMWKSHNKEEKHALHFVAEGTSGKVFQKTEHKVVKKFKEYPVYEEAAQEHNIRLLQQKFLLQRHKIDKHFIIGLYQVKEDGAAVYIMPKVEPVLHQEAKDTEDALDTFIYALKTVNDLGLAHPDYDDGLYGGNNFRNEFYTSDGFTLFDLDGGLEDIPKICLGARFRDQWLIVYNNKKNPMVAWGATIEAWYKAHEGEALSDNPEALLSFVQEKIILLPEKIIEEFKGKITINKAQFFPPCTFSPLPQVKRELMECRWGLNG